jgi:hypothetical protein
MPPGEVQKVHGWLVSGEYSLCYCDRREAWHNTVLKNYLTANAKVGIAGWHKPVDQVFGHQEKYCMSGTASMFTKTITHL